MELKLRENTLDLFVIKEQKGYKTVFNNHQGGPVLDVGGNIGAFEIEFYPWYSDTQFFAFEPEPENFEILKYHTSEMENVQCFQNAVAKEEGPIDFYVNSLKNKGTHTLRPTRGREKITVSGTPFRDVLANIEPEIIKMDIEGGEWFLMEELMNLPSYVRAIAIELHLNAGHYRTNEAVELHASLIKRFPHCSKGCVYKPESKNWTITTICHS